MKGCAPTSRARTCTSDRCCRILIRQRLLQTDSPACRSWIPLAIHEKVLSIAKEVVAQVRLLIDPSRSERSTIYSMRRCSMTREELARPRATESGTLSLRGIPTAIILSSTRDLTGLLHKYASRMREGSCLSRRTLRKPNLCW